MAAKDTQNIASNAKRAATTLRNIAEMGVSLEDRGIMLAAARAVDTFAKDRAATAKRQKADEQARDRFVAAETPKVKALIEAQWPATTLLDKAAIIAEGEGLYILDLIIKHPQHAPTRAKLERELDEYCQRSISSVANHTAWQAWHKKLSPPQALAERTESLNRKFSDPRTAATAARFAAFLERLDHQEAA